MMKPRMLAASARPLANVLADSLRSSSRWSRLRTNLPDEADRDDQAAQLSLDLEEGHRESNEYGGAPPALNPDEAAAAVLLGKAFEQSREVLAILRQPDTLAIIEVPHSDFVDPINRVLRKHVLGPDAKVLNGDELTRETTASSPGTVVIFESPDETTPRKDWPGGVEFAAAVQLRCAIIGITSSPGLLPRELVSLAEHRIVVPPLDGATIADVIEAVTGKQPSIQIDDRLAGRVTPQILSIAVRADLGPERSSARVQRLLDAERQKEEGPLLSEIYGLGPAKQWGLDLAADLRAYAAGKLPWSLCPKGLLLSGPPGTAKTTFARALSREAGVHFISTSYSAWQSHKDGHLGSVTAAIRGVFAEAKANRPCIVFIDEIDSLPTRGSAGRNDSWFTAVVNCVLDQLDGFAKREGVVVVAACNDPSKLDSALVRAGRLDHHIAIPLPDVPALIGIFRMYLRTDLEGVDLRAAALAAQGSTGADVERWVRVARRAARRADRALTLSDLLEVVRSGRPEWPADVRRRVAYHEAGHAIALHVLDIAEPTALSIGGSGGLAESLPGEMRAQTRVELEKLLVGLLGGRAAEEIVFGTGVTAGAGGSSDSDLSRATRLALRIETAFGFGALGLVCLHGDLSDRDLLMFDSLRTAVTSTIDRAYAMALEVLSRNRSTLDALAAALFSAGYLDQAEIAAVLAKVPLRPQPSMDPNGRLSKQLDEASVETRAIIVDTSPQKSI